MRAELELVLRANTVTISNNLADQTGGNGGGASDEARQLGVCGVSARCAVLCRVVLCVRARTPTCARRREVGSVESGFLARVSAAPS